MTINELVIEVVKRKMLNVSWSIFVIAELETNHKSVYRLYSNWYNLLAAEKKERTRISLVKEGLDFKKHEITVQEIEAKLTELLKQFSTIKT